MDVNDIVGELLTHVKNDAQAIGKEFAIALLTAAQYLIEAELKRLQGT